MPAHANNAGLQALGCLYQSHRPLLAFIEHHLNLSRGLGDEKVGLGELFCIGVAIE